MAGSLPIEGRVQEEGSVGESSAEQPTFSYSLEEEDGFWELLRAAERTELRLRAESPMIEAVRSLRREIEAIVGPEQEPTMSTP